MCAASSSRSALVRVAVPVPGLDLLTYLPPPGGPLPHVGARVIVPLGPRTVTGIVVSVAEEPPPAGALVKPIQRVLDERAFVPADVVALARWTAEYYAAGPGQAILAVLPPKTRGGRADAHKTLRVAAITPAGRQLLRGATPGGGASPGGRRDGCARAQVGRGGARLTLTAGQRATLDLLADAPGGLATPALAARGFAPGALARLARRGLIAFAATRVERDPFGDGVPPAGADAGVQPDAAGGTRPLTSEQAGALERLRALAEARAFRVALVHGVTGSGKTELYLRLAAGVRDGGRRVLMLVPEIALTPALAAIVRGAFGGRVAIQHSGLSDGERHDQWQRIRRGEVDVVVGTRSAVFAPLQDVGLIVVDEEHDGSYKQEESPRYNGRDVAIVRAQRAGALVILGSATPSMETYHRATSGKYERVVLERRVLDRPLAGVAVVDMREEYAAGGAGVILSRALAAALRHRQDRREQSLVLLNRRGFATAIFCRQCAGTIDCPNCCVSLVVHGEGASRRARCHYCNYSARVPAACPHCAGPYLEQAGFGTERVEAAVRAACPGARVARLDRDAIRRKGALLDVIARFRDGAIDVLVGTQMIAKGHDFPRVTLVGVVSADVGLGVADFRASERTFQLLTQVCGRAGRGAAPGEAIVQTLHPGHYSIQLARRQDYPAFYERELAFRRAMRYPPFTALVNAIVRAKTLGAAMDDAADVAERVRQAAGSHVRVLGPAPAALSRLRGEYRVQILLKGGNRRLMREVLQAAIAARPDLGRRTVVDVDPQSVT
ncbi:MAG: primosomal protein N' [Acidobacteria bacterium]|nr:primosomal protein N' [Acidobacteriota bacterium]